MDDGRAHILVVEDAKEDQMRYFYYLNRQGYRVTEANDGQDGLDKAFRLAPDLILLDLWLGKLSGWEVVQRLKADEKTKNIPVLVVTGHTASHPWGCDGVLTKPFSLDQLGREIAERVGVRVPNVSSGQVI